MMTTATTTVTSWTVPSTGLVLSEATTLAARRDRSMASITKTQQQQQQQQQQQEQQQDQYYENAFNVTLPVALTILAPELFPSLSKARRLIRQKRILVTFPNTSAQQQEIESAATNTTINQTSAVVVIGTSATRIYPGHVISIPSLSNNALVTNRNSSTTSAVQQQQQQPPIANTTGYPNLSYTKVAGLLPQVVYQDDDIAILHKLAGMICHSVGKGGYDSNSILKMAPLVLSPPTTARGHLHHLHNDDDSDNDILPLPTLVHRLDTRTSGLLIISKTKTASVSLSHQFATQQVLKTYHALVHGRPRNEEGILESNIVQMKPTTDVDLLHGNGEGATGVDHDTDDGDDNPNGKSATTHYKVLQSIPTSKGTFLSWIEFQPRTGRRHQLRQHAAYELSCPIVGDVLYGKNKNPSSSSSSPSSSSPYMFLCSTRIAFHHPRSKEWLDFSIPTPKRFSSFWEREKGRYENYQRWLLSFDINNNCNTE